jgi:copper chaperone NosL
MKPVVDILPEDMCSQCRMAISEKRCAVAFIDEEGAALKFDDLACMASYLQARRDRSRITAYFVADYEGNGWIKAEEAFFVRSQQIRTPMGGGVVAFKDRARAEAAAAKYQGEVLRFTQVLP